MKKRKRMLFYRIFLVELSPAAQITAIIYLQFECAVALRLQLP